MASALAGAKVGQLAPTWPPAPKTRWNGARCQVVAPVALKILAALFAGQATCPCVPVVRPRADPR
ncbi:MAG: hypothetical protein E6J91_19895 [Deltaproteobacteria bacterium]|nr:MAG: hypothetical protein E6J91_19895 [Deltaproteobacteria bacterium]